MEPTLLNSMHGISSWKETWLITVAVELGMLWAEGGEDKEGAGEDCRCPTRRAMRIAAAWPLTGPCEAASRRRRR